jgi:hypothetical protein
MFELPETSPQMMYIPVPPSNLPDEFYDSASRLPETDHQKISRAAYLNWLQAGSPEGDGQEFWDKAIRELHSNKS